MGKFFFSPTVFGSRGCKMSIALEGVAVWGTRPHQSTQLDEMHPLSLVLSFCMLDNTLEKWQKVGNFHPSQPPLNPTL